MISQALIAAIPGDGIGVVVCNAGLAVCESALQRHGAPALKISWIQAGAG